MRRWSRMLVVALLFAPIPAAAEILLSPGFTARVYVTGHGFDSGSGRNGAGFPSASTLAFDHSGVLYLARTGRRYMGGEVEDIWPVYRIPVGGARLTPDTEARYFHGPPLPNPQVAAIRGGRDLFVTTFDRDRRVGVVYRMVDGRAELVAGGTPPPNTPPLLVQPEGAAFDAAGNLYVADRATGFVVKLDAAGRVVDPRYLGVVRPRVVLVDEADHLWIGSDGEAEAPWQRGPGEIWRVTPQGVATMLLRGPVPGAMTLARGVHPFVADRHAGKIVVITSEGKTSDFATFTDGDAPRSLAFAPITPQTRAAGIAGDLFIVTVSRGVWPVNEVLRVSGPFEELIRKAQAR